MYKWDIKDQLVRAYTVAIILNIYIYVFILLVVFELRKALPTWILTSSLKIHFFFKLDVGNIQLEFSKEAEKKCILSSSSDLRALLPPACTQCN